MDIFWAIFIAVVILTAFCFCVVTVYDNIKKTKYGFDFWYAIFAGIGVIGLTSFMIYGIEHDARTSTLRAAYYHGVSFEINQEVKVNNNGNIETIKQDTIFYIKK